MKRRRSIRYLAGATALATGLFLSGCGDSNIQTNEEENVMIKNDDIEVQTVTDNTINVAETTEQMQESVDEFSEEREEFERLISNSETIYTEGFKSLEKINIDWNGSRQCYEITAENDDTKCEINLLNADLINFFIHQTNCQELYLAHDKDSKLLLSLTECDTIKSISINDCNISSLNGIENLTNLEKIIINNCPNIKDLTPIKDLTNLSIIGINGTKVTDISVLANLPKLTSLNLRCNEITNLEVLDSLENITNIALEFNQIEDIEQLSGLIEKCIITEEYASDIVESCEKQRLSFTTTNYEEEAIVLYITYLASKEAYFVETRNEDQETTTFALTPDCFDFYELTEHLSNCKGIKLTNFPKDFRHFSIAKEENYKKMVIEYCDFDSISFVGDFKNLTYLAIENCPNIGDTFELSLFNMYKMDNLKTLIVKGTNIKNFDSIRYLNSLEGVELKDNNVEDWGFLVSLPNLKIASIEIDNYPFNAKPLETIRKNGVTVWVNGDLLPEPEEFKGLKQEQEKGLGLTPKN